MLRHAITDGTLCNNSGMIPRQALLDRARRWAEAGIDFIQLREKLLPTRELESLATDLLGAIRATHSSTRLIINGRPDVAIAVGAAGVHLPSSGQVTISEARHLFAATGTPGTLIGVSCHTLPEVAAAAAQNASYIFFGPVFEKRIANAKALPGSGLDLLAQACALASPVPVVAIGGITHANYPACMAAGAAGIAAIRLFGG